MSRKKKAEREILLDQHKEIDNQGELIDSIHNNVKIAGSNLNNINNELDNQGERMDRIHEVVLNTNQKVKKTGKVMSSMERRSKCMKAIALFAIVILGIIDVGSIAYVCYDKFGSDE